MEKVEGDLISNFHTAKVHSSVCFVQTIPDASRSTNLDFSNL